MNRIGLIYGAVVLAALPGFAVTAKAASDQDEIIRRLDRLEQAHARLEQENAALRTKLNRVDGGSAARSAPQATSPQYAIRRSCGQPNIALKAPVEYIRACSMYGAGFYTVPGTDACIKIGGYIRLQGGTGGSGEGTVNGADNMAAQGRNDPDGYQPGQLRCARGRVGRRAGADFDWPVARLHAARRRNGYPDRFELDDDLDIAASTGPIERAIPALGSRLYPVRRLHGRQDALVLRPFCRERRLSHLWQSANHRRYRSDRRDPGCPHLQRGQRILGFGFGGRSERPLQSRSWQPQFGRDDPDSA